MTCSVVLFVCFFISFLHKALWSFPKLPYFSCMVCVYQESGPWFLFFTENFLDGSTAILVERGSSQRSSGGQIYWVSNA